MMLEVDNAIAKVWIDHLKSATIGDAESVK